MHIPTSQHGPSVQNLDRPTEPLPLDHLELKTVHLLCYLGRVAHHCVFISGELAEMQLLDYAPLIKQEIVGHCSWV